MAVFKVVTDQDVDGVTIVINPKTNKLEANIPPATSSAVEIEEVTGITNYNDGRGNYVDAPFGITKGGATYPITKVGRIKGTDWLVLQADGLLGSITGGDTGGGTGEDTGGNAAPLGNTIYSNIEFVHSPNVRNGLYPIERVSGTAQFGINNTSELRRYIESGYKLYGEVRRTDKPEVMYTAQLSSTAQQMAVNDGLLDVETDWLQSLVGKGTDKYMAYFGLYVYLMNDSGGKVSLTGSSEDLFAEIITVTGLA